MHYPNGQVGNMPFKNPSEQESIKIKSLVRDNVENSKHDWNSFESSWNFELHPLLSHIADDNLSIWYYAMVLTNQCAKNVPIFQLWGVK